MLKFIFWTLLLGNALLFAYHQGHFDRFLPVNREPARLAQQLNVEKIRLLRPEGKPEARPAPAPGSGPAPAPAPADKPGSEPGHEPAAGAALDADGTAAALPTPVVAANAVLAPAAEVKADEMKADGARTMDTGKNGGDQKSQSAQKAAILACTEIGNFNEADADRFEARLAALGPDTRLARRLIREAGSHIVFMASQGSKENADLKVEQLRALGVTDFYVIQDQSEMRWGISLGVFSTEEAAKKRLEQLRQQGVRTARVGARNTVTKVAVQLRELNGAARDKLKAIKADFPQQQQRNCA